MLRLERLPGNVTAVLIFGRPPLVFGAFACALWVMFTHNPVAYILGVTLLVLAMAFDWIDGWFAARYRPHSRLRPLVDRMMDRIVLSIIFPVLGAGMFWRLHRMEAVLTAAEAQQALLHALFVLAISVLVLLRDQFALFLLGVAQRREAEVESESLTRLRTLVASPMAVLLYAHAFYLPTVGWEGFYRWVDPLNQIPLRVWFVIEMTFLLINIVSATLYLRKYGPMALDDICEDDEVLRRRILSVLPNALTLMNALLGVTAVVFAGYGRVREALFLLIGAVFFDRLDGLVARRLGLTEPLPREDGKPVGIPMGAMLDDISDAVSFCFAPALIYYMVLAGLPSGERVPLPLGLVALVYAGAGVSRLTYFVLDKNPVPGFFKGMPVPAAALLVMAPVEMAAYAAKHLPDQEFFWSAVATGAMVVASVTMNLFPVRYLHVGRLMGRRPGLKWFSLIAWVVTVFTPIFGIIVFAFCVVYVISPVFTSRIDPRIAAQERPPAA
ncbi:MAG: CDP-alcohol phosphatidyltransferase family protein [Candidatus Lambdaproteobacteria bacterium]|nr:CDP-alcohol phosphatidyltransferase family protein [Candidatus Lambdaproteobacteria bacterium]